MANNFGNLVVKLSADAAQFRSEFSKAVSGAESAMGKIGSAVGGLKAKLGALGVGVSFGALFNESVKAAIEAEQASAKLDAVLKVTGYSAGIAKKELDGMADAMAKSTQFDDESIRNASAELLKFGNIQGDVFRGALKLSADVAAFNGEDVAASAQSIGKALLDVETASRLLKNAGVALSEQQKDQIKAFTESGDTAKAQQLVLELLKKTYDGMSESLNSGLAKSTKDVSKSWGEFTEAFGRTDTFKTTTSLLSGVVSIALDELTLKLSGMNDELSRAQRTASGKINGPVFESQYFKDKKKETLAADLGAANKRIRQAEEAEYARQKKLQEEGKKHAKGLAALTEKQRKAMAESDQWVADSFSEQLQEANKAQSEWAKSAAETARGFMDMVSPADEIVRKIQAVEFLMETIDEKTGKPFLSADQGELALLSLNEQIDALNEVKDTGKDAYADLTRAVEGWGRASADAIVDFAFTGKTAFSGMVDSMLKDLARMAVYKNVTKPLFDSFGGGDLMSTLGGFFGGGRASGGPVNPGQFYVVGENGPEILVPNSAGTIIPNGGGMAGGSTYNVAVSVDARGGQVSGDNAQAAELGRRIEAAVRGVLFSEKRPGGMLAA